MLKWTARAVIPFVLGIATLGVAQAQEPAGGRRALTALDYAETQQLYEAYLGLPSPGGGGLRVAGLYEDVLVKTPQGWRFKLRAYTSILNLQREASPPPTR